MSGGYMSSGVYVLGGTCPGKCPGGKCLGGKILGGKCPGVGGGVSVLNKILLL